MSSSPLKEPEALLAIEPCLQPLSVFSIYIYTLFIYVAVSLYACIHVCVAAHGMQKRVSSGPGVIGICEPHE